MIITITENELIVGLLSIIVISFFYNPLHDFGHKIHDSLTKVEVFIPTKTLQIKDEILVQMLDENVYTRSPSYVITDPHQYDNPIIFCSNGFVNLTGYKKNEIEGRNCRFLQGKDTKKLDVDKIREAIKSKTQASVQLLNYKKDGTPFLNQFFICPLLEENGQVAYFLGCQAEGPPKGSPDLKIMSLVTEATTLKLNSVAMRTDKRR